MEVLKQFNIEPKNIELYEQAFTHTSYSNENNMGVSYERLEFLGDKVVDLIISEYLYRHMDLKEGDMTKLRASYVCENALYEYALSLRFNEYVKLGKGEESSGGKFRKAILADVFEAFVGALYLDQGLNVAKRFLNDTIISSMIEKETYFSDYKSLFQERIQIDNKKIEYILIDESGPAHDKTFTSIVKVEDIIFGKGVGSTKKEAEQKAAKDALDKQA
ncbi:MAG: ribonuclease III [Bacilli bacterium]|nr:ribonuclease III [Bacilli bacterium]